jgi:hypothetical protein
VLKLRLILQNYCSKTLSVEFAVDKGDVPMRDSKKRMGVNQSGAFPHRRDSIFFIL